MAEDSFRRFYPQSDFLALGSGLVAALPLFRTEIGLLALTTAPSDVRLTVLGAQLTVVIEWVARPPDADLLLVDATVAAFVGGTTTSAPFEYNSFPVATSTSATPVVKINQTTTPLDAGTYQVSWTSSLRMQAVAANTGVEGKIRLTRSDGVFVEQDDAWNLSNRHAYNGSMPFQLLAGQTITALLTFSRLGASGTAEMSGARVTIDKIS